MHEFVGRLAGSRDVADGVNQALEQEFEARLVESSTLAVRVAYSVLRRREDAEDVAQEAFTRAYRAFADLRDRDRFRAWLVRTTWRLAINRWRADRRRSAREQVHAENTIPGPTAEQTAEDRRRAAELWRAIDALPDKLRIALVLASIEGHNIGEVAALLGVPPGTVKSRLFLARQRLKEQLQWTR